MPRRGAKTGRRGGRGGGRPPAAISTSKMNQNALTMKIEPWMPLTPPKCAKWLRYAENVTLSSPSGAVGTYMFSANSPFDPNVTGTGHQPMGYDTMTNLYWHYHVDKARISVTFRNKSLGTPSVGIRVDGALTPITSIERIVETGGLVFAVLEPSDAFGCNKTLDMSVDIARLNGVSKKSLIADTELGALWSASPAEQTYFHLSAWDANAVTADLLLLVVLEQHVIFTEPKVNVQSSPEKKSSYAEIQQDSFRRGSAQYEIQDDYDNLGIDHVGGHCPPTAEHCDLIGRPRILGSIAPRPPEDPLVTAAYAANEQRLRQKRLGKGV
jgi:hypothetical protein